MVSAKKSIFAKGFTLIELLVVIVIMASLAGVSYVVILGVRGGATVISCKKNLEQIGIAGREYGDSMAHKDILPCSGSYSDNWWEELAPKMPDGYVKAAGKKPMKVTTMFHCPGDSRGEVSGNSMDGTVKNVSYVSWTDNSADPDDPASPIRRNKKNGSTPWLSDGVPVKGQSVTDLASFNKLVVPALDRHDDTILVLYADGSVKSFEADPEGEPSELYSRIAPDMPKASAKGASSKGKKKKK